MTAETLIGCLHALQQRKQRESHKMDWKSRRRLSVAIEEVKVEIQRRESEQKELVIAQEGAEGS